MSNTSVSFNNQSVYYAETLLNDISTNPTNNIYLTIGRTLPWSDELSPDSTSDSYDTILDVWYHMIGGKKITGNDVYHVIPRYNWTTGTVYTEVDQGTSYIDEQYYVLTSEYNIYKCISNANGSVSTVEPSSLLTDNISETADNYKWKYMGTLTDAQQVRFLTDSYMPVKKLSADDFSLNWDVQENAVPGAIYHINVTNGGTNYSDANVLTVTITGDGLGANATATINTSTNTINSIIMNSYGSGYTYANVAVSGGSGSGAVLYPLLSPPEGHGADIVYELNAKYLLLDVNIDGNENGTFIADNDYRKYSIILNPKNRNTGNVVGNSTFSQFTSIQLSSTGSDFIDDEYVYIGTSLQTATFSGVVLNWDSSNSIIHLINTRGTITSDVLNGSNSAAARYITNDITYGECTSMSGKILFNENIRPISRNIDQTENFKIVLGF